MTFQELKEIKDRYIDDRKKEQDSGVIVVDVHMGTCGIAAGARDIFQVLEREKERLNLDHLRLRVTGCAGLCSMEPMITVQRPGEEPVKYGKLNGEKTREIIFSHILGGHPKTEYAIGRGLEKPQKRVGME